MSAIIWKEIRENLKWAVLLMLGVGACMAFALYQMTSPYYWREEGSLLAGEFQIITIIGAAVGASLLGLLQTVPEMWRDQWAFLVHRPLTRTRLFFGKVIAGLTLYGAVILLPLLVAAVWSAMPGHIASPFHWRMILPGIADVLAGVVFYLAAVLTGIRQARWYSSRALPFALAIVCECLVVNLPEFWMALLAVVVAVAILLAAAWGSFIASGQYRSQGRIAKAALGVVLCFGILCVGLVGAGILAALVEENRSDSWTSYEVDKEGRVLRVNWGGYHRSIVSVTDLAGKAVEDYKGKPCDTLRETYLLNFWQLRVERDWGRSENYRSGQRFYRLLNTDEQLTWYYVRSERLIVGYDRQIRRRIGTIGPGGFSPAGTMASQRFPDEELPDLYGFKSPHLGFSSAVYCVDLNARQAKIVMAGTPDQPILGASQMQPQGNWQSDRPVGIVTPSRIYLLPAPSQKPISVAYDYPSDEYSNVRVAALPKGGYAIWYAPSYLRSRTSQPPEHVVIVSATGAVVNRYDLPPIIRESPPPTWPHALWALVIPIAGLIAAFVGRLIWVWMVWGYPMLALELRNLQHEMFGSESAFMILFGVVLLVGAVCWASVVFGIARRYAFTRHQAWWWAIGGFFFGPAGLLTLLALREWPARVACAACGRKRLVDRWQCEHCGADFPPPAPTGTEIFDEPEASIGG